MLSFVVEGPEGDSWKH